MKLLDEKGLETVWATCKVKFALAGHTHKLSQLTNDKGFVTGSVSGNTITINGVSTTWSNTWRGIQDNLLSTSTSDSLSANQGKILKGLIDSKANSSDLSSYAQKYQALNQVQFTTDSTGEQTLKLEYVDGNTTYKSIENANPDTNGFMSKEDKVKLDKIQAGANNYTLPTASNTTLGGIKTNYVPKGGGTLFKVNTDTEGNANTYIPGLIYGNDEYLSEIEFTADSDEHTSFDGKDFHSYDQEGTEKRTISLPDKDGTLALTSDIPDVSSLCKFNSANAIERCVYGRINFMTPIAEELNLDSILNEEGIIIFAHPSTASNITCSEGFIYNHDYIDNNKRVEPGLFLIMIDAGIPVVLPLQ